jgi:Phage integrase family
VRRQYGRTSLRQSLGGLRDPKNTRRDVRHALDRAGFSWVTSHSFRKTTATLLDQAGVSARVIADQLGHARPSMTQDVYMGRKLVDVRAVEALEGTFGRSELSGNDEPLKGKDVGKCGRRPSRRRTATVQACDLHLRAP